MNGPDELRKLIKDLTYPNDDPYRAKGYAAADAWEAETKDWSGAVGELQAEVHLLNEQLEAAQARIEELERALLFYADPERHPLNARWEEDYPGGITYHEGRRVFCDTGQIAKAALAGKE